MKKKSRLDSEGYACYHWVQHLLSSCFLSKNIKVHRTIILHVVLYECETWSLTTWEEHRLKVFESMVLRGLEEVAVRGFMIYTPQ
jgi:hypothetical protein